jgi:hypothetical protein
MLLLRQRRLRQRLRQRLLARRNGVRATQVR